MYKLLEVLRHTVLFVIVRDVGGEVFQGLAGVGDGDAGRAGFEHFDVIVGVPYCDGVCKWDVKALAKPFKCQAFGRAEASQFVIVFPPLSRAGVVFQGTGFVDQNQFGAGGQYMFFDVVFGGAQAVDVKVNQVRHYHVGWGFGDDGAQVFGAAGHGDGQVFHPDVASVIQHYVFLGVACKGHVGVKLLGGVAEFLHIVGLDWVGVQKLVLHNVVDSCPVAIYQVPDVKLAAILDGTDDRATGASDDFPTCFCGVCDGGAGSGRQLASDAEQCAVKVYKDCAVFMYHTISLWTMIYFCYEFQNT